jgi:hypothetical protein
MTHLNLARKRYAENLNGRSMTQAELRLVEQQTRETWASMSQGSKDALKLVYQQGVRRRRAGQSSVPSASSAELAVPSRAFKSPWGIGCSANPIKKEKFCEAPRCKFQAELRSDGLESCSDSEIRSFFKSRYVSHRGRGLFDSDCMAHGNQHTMGPRYSPSAPLQVLCDIILTFGFRTALLSGSRVCKFQVVLLDCQ